MGKGRGRRRGHKHVLNIKNAKSLQENATSPTLQEQLTPPQGGDLRSRLSFLDKTFRDWWFYVAAVSLVVNLTYTFRPQIQVKSSTMSQDPLETLFTISNTGPWPLRDVKMICVLSDGNRNIKSENNTTKLSRNAPAQGNPNLEELPSGHSATRDCGFSHGIHLRNIDMRSIRINIITSYRWPLWPAPINVEEHFNSRQIGERFILVPDVEPRPKSPPSPY